MRQQDFIIWHMLLLLRTTEKRYYHFWAYTAIIAYYWYVWALYRESCGAVMGDALINWRDMAEKYADHILDCEGE